MVFNDDGELESLDLPTAFTDLFVYEPDTGALEMIASGGSKSQQQLRRVFYRTMCRLEVEDADPESPEYRLDHLLKPDFVFRLEPADRIESVTVPQILLVPLVDDEGAALDLEALSPRFRKSLSWAKALSIIDGLLESRDMRRSQVKVEHIHIRVQFLGDGTRKGKT
jgi:hypothetical protein